MQGNVEKKKQQNSGYTMRSFLATQPPLGNDPNSEDMFYDFSHGLDKMQMMKPLLSLLPPYEEFGCLELQQLFCGREASWLRMRNPL